VQKKSDEAAEGEAAQAALREGLERAHELICEARFVICQQEPAPDAEPRPDLKDGTPDS
jgi:hypothetical protein